MENRALTTHPRKITDLCLVDVRSRNTPAPQTAPDRTVLESLFTAHHEQVFMAAYRVCGNVADAEDVLQSVFLRFIKRNDRSEDDKVFGDNPARYLCKAAINAGLDLLRSKQRSTWVSLDDDSHADDHPSSSHLSVDKDIQNRQLRRQLRQALLRLNPRAAEIFALRYFEELNNSQIAETFGTSISGIAVTLHRTRQRLQELLREFEDS